MPVTFHVLPDRGLVLVRFSGVITVEQIRAASVAYVSDPGYAPGQKQLVYLDEVTGYDIDPVAFMDLQASKAKRLALAGVQSLVVYIAPTGISREVGNMFVRSWDAVEGVVPMIQPSEAAALALLGQAEESLWDLIAAADRETLQ